MQTINFETIHFSVYFRFDEIQELCERFALDPASSVIMLHNA